MTCLFDFLSDVGDWLRQVTPSVWIAVLALIFTVASFYVLNARRGSLRTFMPHSFAAVVAADSTLRLQFPLVFHNTGAVPIVVQDLRLMFPDVSDAELIWQTTRAGLQIADRDYAAVFAVAGRSTEQRFIEFGGPFPGIVLVPRTYIVNIEAKVSHSKSWVRLASFPLHAQVVTAPGIYVVYRNDASDVSEAQIAEVRKAGQELRKALEGVRGADGVGS
jgi:hypothetical protein